MTQFWRLCYPNYPSDYHDAYINGGLEHPFRLPGVKCEVCGQTWGGSRVLPFECPAPLRSKAELQDSWPIDGSAHRALRLEVLGHLPNMVAWKGVLFPGDAFQPGFLDVPSRPKADFLWASLGSVVVSDRVRNALVELTDSDVAFVPVRLRRIGNADPTASPPIPDSGEPEDILGQIEPLADTSHIGPYWEMIVRAESALPAGLSDVAECSGCGRVSYDSTSRRLTVTDEMWTGAHVFTLATTSWIIVTDVVKKALSALGVENLTYVPASAA